MIEGSYYFPEPADKRLDVVLFIINRNDYGKEEIGHSVAEPGVEPGLEDYEPSVQPYTTPHVCDNRIQSIIIRLNRFYFI